MDTRDLQTRGHAYKLTRREREREEINERGEGKLIKLLA